MRHATVDDLDRLDALLTSLRELDQLKERTPGNFQHRSRAFLHFHADGDDLYADVRLDGATFERRRVTTAAAQARLVSAVTKVVAGR